MEGTIMCTLHLVENGTVVGNESGGIYIKNDSEKTVIPIETVDGINVFGKTQITTQCIEECMKRNIPIAYFSSSGGYIGGFIGTRVSVRRQRKQSVFNTTDISLDLAKIIISTKISNQITVLRRYNRNNDISIDDYIRFMKQSKNSICACNSIAQLMGYEGIAARYYFEAMGKIVKPEFSFSNRSKYPPKDHFNALLSFGYSLLYKELFGIISSKGLNPYFGFIHEDKENHPALVSDMLEEWRAVIVDSMVLSLVNGNEISLDDFDNKSVYLNSLGRRKVIQKYNNKMNTLNSYYEEHSNASYRKIIGYQIQSLVHVIENDDCSFYKPIQIR